MFKNLIVLLMASVATQLYANDIHMKCDVTVTTSYPEATIKVDDVVKDTATITITTGTDGTLVSGGTSVSKSNLKILATNFSTDEHDAFDHSSSSRIYFLMRPKENKSIEYRQIEINRVSGELVYREDTKFKQIKIVGTCRRVQAMF